MHDYHTIWKVQIQSYIAPDIFQEQMSTLMDDLEFVRVYLGNLLVITLG